MKANWKFALMGLAALAIVACKPGGGNEPVDPEDPEDEYVKVLSATDNTLDDWAKVPAEYIVEAVCPEDAAMLGLKSVKAYADKYYIFLQVEVNPDDVTDLAWVPFHIYINTDNSDLTGGYSDQFTDPNADVLLEGAVFGAEAATFAEAAIPYAPGVFYWWGEVGGEGWEWTDPSTEHSADDAWGAIIGEGDLQGTTSQFVDGKIEIEIMRELVPTQAGWSEEAFGLGFDIQQNWSSVGILPCASATDENPTGHAAKMTVRVNK